MLSWTEPDLVRHEPIPMRRVRLGGIFRSNSITDDVISGEDRGGKRVLVVRSSGLRDPEGLALFRTPLGDSCRVRGSIVGLYVAGAAVIDT
jgi:hypothetical protein